MPRALKHFHTALTILLIVIAGGIAVVGLVSRIHHSASFRLLIVRSGSMAPTLPVGSLVVVRTAPNYQPGDIVTFRRQGGFITHRIVAASATGFSTSFTTQGDANPIPDGTPVTSTSVVGKVWFSIPSLGKILAFTKTRLGYVLMVLLPALAIMVNETLVIMRELKIGKKHRTTKALRGRAQDQKKVQPRLLPVHRIKQPASVHAARRRTKKKKHAPTPDLRGASALLSGFLILCVIGSTGAYFSDAAAATNNFFSTLSAPPPPVSGLVINEVLYQSSCRNGDEKQWIELFNGSNHAINLKKWQIKEVQNNAVGTIRSKEIIQPGELIVISRSDGAFSSSCYGRPPSERLVIDLGCQEQFSDTIGILQLIDPAGNIVDRVEYGGPGQPSAPIDQSIERVSAGYDTAAGDTFVASDFVTRFPSTPGFALPTAQPLVLNEFQIRPDRKQFIEIYNPSSQTINLTTWTIRSEKMRVIGSIKRNAALAAGERKTFTYDGVWPTGGQKIYLVNPVGTIIDAFNYHRFDPPHGNSWARIADGTGSWQLDSTPTPNALNSL